MNALKRYSRTLFCSVGFLAAALVAGCGGGGDQGRDPILGLPAADIVSVTVTPATASIAKGAAQAFVATASYTDGSSRDVTVGAAWTSATPAVATVNAASGVATGVNAGTSAITAAFNGKSGSATLTVTPATLQSIALAPLNPSVNIGASQRFAVIGTFSDNTTADVTAASTFKSATPAIATIDAATGVALGVSAGPSLITATSGGVSTTTTLTVKPVFLQSLSVAPQGPVLQIGATQQLAVTAGYSDGTSTDVTAASTFVSATPANAKVGSTGIVTGVAAGSSVVTASFGTMNASTTATVNAATLSSIAVTPTPVTIGVAGVQQFVATATYSDNSTAIVTSSVSWTSGNVAIATVLPTGAATGVSPGTTTITATSGLISGFATLTVTAVAPPPPVLNPVILGTAGNFGVLAGTSLTNNSGGLTFITGDVGSPSQTTDPVVAPGYTNYKSGKPLTDGLADLDKAITDANGRICDVTFAAGIDLGGKTLPPGVYCYAGSISITGTLNLSGNGVYIFRTATTLNTTANAIVALLNGADAENVTWVPVGPTTLGANGAFVGSILAKSAAITVGDMTTLQNGRVLSQAAVTLKNNVITK
jgi:uncharacterized protein YjdB